MSFEQVVDCLAKPGLVKSGLGLVSCCLADITEFGPTWSGHI